MSTEFGFQQLVDLCRQTHETMQSRAARSVDLSLVVRNWLFGWYIVEFEQAGVDRAQYGQETLKKLSAALRETIGRGFSVDNLAFIRRFFMTYRNTLSIDNKSETVSRISMVSPLPTIILPTSPALGTPELIETLLARFTLGWSHYVTLLTIDSSEAAGSTKSKPLPTIGASANWNAKLPVPSTNAWPSAATRRKSGASHKKVW